MYIGVDYYPEHWDKSRWPVDAKLMRAAGLNVVRLAEFAWVNMEPEEGRFDFAFLDDAIATLAKQGHTASSSALPPRSCPPGAPGNIPRHCAPRRAAAAPAMVSAKTTA